MVPESEIINSSGNSMEAPDSKVQAAVKEVETKYQTCVSNYEDNTFASDASLGEHALEGHTLRTKEIGLLNTGNSKCNALVEEKCQDTTESSSSFDDVFGDESGAPSDSEVVSDFRKDDSFDGHGELFRIRKKRLTSHWRTYIQPLMWRCKWVELQIKNLNIQEHDYAKAFTKYNQQESFQVERSKTDLCSREVPFCGGSRRHQILKRNTRIRIEDRVDVTSYMSQHNVFSYCENKKASSDGICFRDESMNRGEKVKCNDFGLDDKSAWVESSEIEESLEEIVEKIGVLKGQVSKLKTRLDKVISVDAGKLAYEPSLVVPCNTLTSSGPNSASPPNNGDRVAVGSQLISQYHTSDVVLPESAVASHGELTHGSDIMESTNQPDLGGPCHIENEILIYNDKIQEGMNNVEEVKMQPPVAISVVESNMVTNDQAPKKIRSISELTTPNIRKSLRRRRRRRS